MQVIIQSGDRMRLVTAVLLISLVGNVFLAVAIFTPWDPSGSALTGQTSITPLPGVGAGLAPEGSNTTVCSDCEALLEYYRDRANVACMGISGQARDYAALQAPAVMTSTRYERRGPFLYRDTQEIGTMMNISVEIVPGQGRVLVHTTPLMGVVFQDAANTAVAVAEKRTMTSLADQDVIFSIEAGSEIPEVDGPSAGALMTVLAEAAIGKKVPDQRITLTGTIDEGGLVGAIGGVVEKAQAAKDAGKEIILLPEENQQLVQLSTETRNAGGFSFTRQVPETVDAKEYLERTIGIKVEYVSDIEDLEGFLFGGTA